MLEKTGKRLKVLSTVVFCAQAVLFLALAFFFISVNVIFSFVFAYKFFQIQLTYKYFFKFSLSAAAASTANNTLLQRDCITFPGTSARGAAKLPAIILPYR